MPVNTKVEKPVRKPTDVMADIETKLATIDGISTADAFALGGLVREYGQTIAGETSSGFVTPILDMMLRPRKNETNDAKPPWERDHGF